MEFYLLNDDFKNIGILSRVLEAQVIHRFHSPGEITVRVPFDERIPSTAAYIYDPESKSCAVIEKTLSTHGESITLEGRMLECLLERQMVRSSGFYVGRVDSAVRYAVEKYAIDSGCVTNLEFSYIAEVAGDGMVNFEWIPLSEWLYGVLKSYGASFKVTLDTADDRLYFSVVKGVDRTSAQEDVPPVIFLEDDGTLVDGTFKQDVTGYVNTAYVIGNDGTYVCVPENAPTGLQRRETVISAKDIYPNSFETVEAYKDALYNRGLEKLRGYKSRVFFSGSDSGKGAIVLGEDYNLGDLCEIQSMGVGVFGDVRVTSVTETYKNGVKKVTAGFGDGEITLSEMIRREAEKY